MKSWSHTLLLIVRITMLICLLNSSSNSTTYKIVGKDGLVTHFLLPPPWNSRLSGTSQTMKQTRGRRFLFAHISFYPNAQSCFNLSRLILNRDICLILVKRPREIFQPSVPYVRRQSQTLIVLYFVTRVENGAT